LGVRFEVARDCALIARLRDWRWRDWRLARLALARLAVGAIGVGAIGARLALARLALARLALAGFGRDWRWRDWRWRALGDVMRRPGLAVGSLFQLRSVLADVMLARVRLRLAFAS
tara:strand:- start:151 stop:498 length:348 start_codon:yes stop_codon:yes gene_type:complete